MVYIMDSAQRQKNMLQLNKNFFSIKSLYCYSDENKIEGIVFLYVNGLLFLRKRKNKQKITKPFFKGHPTIDIYLLQRHCSVHSIPFRRVCFCVFATGLVGYHNRKFEMKSRYLTEIYKIRVLFILTSGGHCTSNKI